MIELDKRLIKVTNLINRCYERLYPDFPKYPQFSFTRAMIIIWLNTIYKKMQPTLFELFTIAFKSVVQEKMKPLIDGKPLENNEKHLQKIEILAQYLINSLQ